MSQIVVQNTIKEFCETYLAVMQADCLLQSTYEKFPTELKKKKTWHNAVRTLKLLTLVSNIVVTFHCFLSSPAHTDLVFLSMIKFPSRKRREDGMMGASRSARTELSGFTKR